MELTGYETLNLYFVQLRELSLVVIGAALAVVIPWFIPNTPEWKIVAEKLPTLYLPPLVNMNASHFILRPQLEEAILESVEPYARQRQ